MFSTILFLICGIIKIICCVILLIFALFLGLRLWVEPFKETCKCKTKLDGKVALVTGGNSGIGFETAKDLAKRGARVIIASRNEKKSEEAVAVIKEISGNNDVEHRYLNLVQLDNIREFVQNFNKDFDRLDILVNNAGCGTIKKGKTEYGIDTLMQINYVGPFLLTFLLLDRLKLSKQSRIVIVSSYLHALATNFDPKEMTNPKDKHIINRYADTKLCDVLWTKELAKRLPKGVTVNAVHPGLVMTNIFDNILPVYRYLLYFIIYILFKTAEEGAQTIIHLCVSPKLNDSTGNYFQNCKETKPAKHTEDDDLSRRLWEETVALVEQKLPSKLI